MNLKEALAKKEENLEKLILNREEAIHKELYKYEEAAFYIRLQSECFNLYPIVVQALASLIEDKKKRAIFCSIVKGHKLARLAAFHNLTPEEAVQEFRSTVRELHRQTKEGAFTAKKSANIRLISERDELKCRLQKYKELYAHLQQTDNNLRDQLEELLYNAEIQQTDMQKEETRKETGKETTKTWSHLSFVVRWSQWLKRVYYRL